METHEQHFIIHGFDVYIHIGEELNRPCGTVTTSINGVSIVAKEYIELLASGKGVGVIVTVNNTLSGFTTGDLYQNRRIIRKIYNGMIGDPLYTDEELSAMEEFLKIIIPLTRAIYSAKLAEFTKVNPKFFMGGANHVDTLSQDIRKTLVLYTPKSNMLRYDSEELTDKEWAKLEAYFNFCDKADDLNKVDNK